MLNRLKEEHCASLLEFCRHPLCSLSRSFSEGLSGRTEIQRSDCDCWLVPPAEMSGIASFCPRVAGTPPTNVAHDAKGESVELQTTRVIIFLANLNRPHFAA